MTGMHSFAGKTAVIVCHDSVPGPPHSLAHYLLKHNIYRLYFIGHVNQFTKDNPVQSSYLEVYENGKIIKRITTRPVRFPEPIMYIHDILLTFYWSVFVARSSVDYFIGLGNLNAVVGIILKLFGKVQMPIYYVIDYIPQRFTNVFMNALYHRLDQFCAWHAHATWNYGEKMIYAREEKWKQAFPKQLLVPHGIDQYVTAAKNNFYPHKLIYMGSLIKQQGIQSVLEALPLVRQSIRDITLDIIGVGEYKDTLKEMVKKLNLTESTSFLGFIKDPSEVDTIISHAALGIATYKNELGFVTYSEPSKVKRYLACGVPVLLTVGTPLAEVVKKKKCGIICFDDSKDIATKVISILKDKKTLMQLRENSIRYSKHFTWERIYTRAFHLSI